MSSYQDLEIYKEALALFYRIHPFALRLPKTEKYELGSQLRRSADSINTNIVEGFGRRKYKSEFVRFLIIAHSSAMETKLHLEKIGHLYQEHRVEANQLRDACDILGARIHTFIKYVESNWRS